MKVWGLFIIATKSLLLGTSVLLSNVNRGGTGSSSDGEGLQAVSCGPRGLGESCSWDHTSTALGLVENGTQMKAWKPVQLQRLNAQNIYLQILIEADGQRLLTSQRPG